MSKIINFARLQVGKPYVFGRSGPDSFDCSGLTKRAVAQTDVITTTDALDNAAMFPLLNDRIGTTAATGEYLRHEDGLYRVQQEHTIQVHQPPSVHTAALYTRVQEPGSGPEPWVQGQSYAKGVEVTHVGGVWLSGVDNNVWEPGADGVGENIWREVT